MSLTDLVETSLQKNTDRLIIGEVVGSEVLAMLQAMQGGQGSVSTIHAKSGVDTISRMVTLITSHMANISDRDATRLVAQHVDLIVHIGVIDESELDGGASTASSTRSSPWTSATTSIPSRSSLCGSLGPTGGPCPPASAPSG